MSRETGHRLRPHRSAEEPCSRIHGQFRQHDLRQAQEEFWASKQPQAGSSSIPTGKASATSGGFTLSGKWSYCSGVDYVAWVTFGAIVGTIAGPTPMPDLRHFLVPISACKILDDWHVMGLAGTGSKSVILDDVFVPSRCVVPNVDVSNRQSPGARANAEDPMRCAPLWALWTFALPAIASGVAGGAYDVLLEEFRGRATSAHRDMLFDAKKSAIQIHLAESGALIDTSCLLFLSTMRDTFEQLRAGKELTIERRVRNRRDATYSVSMALRAGEILLRMAGARGLKTDSVVQRALRDLQRRQTIRE